MPRIVFEARERSGGRQFATGGLIPFKKESVGTFLSVGMRVRITCGPYDLDGDHSYHGRYIGCVGQIVRIPEIPLTTEEDVPTITIGVLLDDNYNERSQYGCYWFKPNEITVITEQENNKMLLLKPYKIAKVTVEGYGDQYVAHYEDCLEEGDRVVVANDEYHCGVVTDVFTDAHMNRDPKFQIVCKIDDSAFIDRVARAKRAKELESKLDSAVRDYQKVALFEMMATKSPAIAELLKEYKEVTGGNS